MIYKLGYNLPKAEINKRIMAYEANQAKIEQLEKIINETRSVAGYPSEYVLEELRLTDSLPDAVRCCFKQDLEAIIKSGKYVEANQAEIARLQGEYDRLSEANRQDLKTWEEIWQEEQSEIVQLKAKLELCREALQSLVDECPYYIASVGEPTFGKVSAALEAIEKGMEKA